MLYDFMIWRKACNYCWGQMASFADNPHCILAQVLPRPHTLTTMISLLKSKLHMIT